MLVVPPGVLQFLSYALDIDQSLVVLQLAWVFSYAYISIAHIHFNAHFPFSQQRYQLLLKW